MTASHKPIPNDLETTAVYLLVCRGTDGRIVVPPFSAYTEEEALARFDDESEAPEGRLYGHELLRVLKAFELENGRVTWANREPVGPGPALFVALDSGCYGSPYIDFNTLLSAAETDLDSLWTARVY